MQTETIYPIRRPPEIYQYLPLPAKCAIEYLDCQSTEDRTIANLDKYLDHYFKTYGQVCDEFTRYSCHYRAIKRFSLEGTATQGSLYQPVTEAVVEKFFS